MKMTLLLLSAVLILLTAPGRAESNLQLNAELTNNPTLAAQDASFQLNSDGNGMVPGGGYDFAPAASRTSSPCFAQLSSTPDRIPAAVMWFFGLVALGVLGMRVLTVHHAKAMADQEHQTHHARSRMYQMLHLRD